VSNGSRLHRFIEHAALALASALIFGAYARWPTLAFLGFVAIVPWVLLYTDDRDTRVSIGYYAVFAYLTWLVLYPQAFRFGTVAALAIGAIAVLPMLVFAPVLRSVHRRFHLPRTVSVPLVWVAVEWLRATLTVGHFDLYRLGYSQARFPELIQIADVLGVYGVSFVVAAVNGWFADAFFAWRDRRAPIAGARRLQRLTATTIGLAIVFVAVLAYGVFRLATIRTEEGPSLAVVQPNVAHSLRNGIGVHLWQVRLTDREVERAAADLIIWPEFAIQDNLRREGAYLEDLAWIAREKEALILVGAMSEDAGQPGRTMNSACLVDDRGAIVGRYDKQLLFPWSEYIPFDDTLKALLPSAFRLHRMLCRKGWGFLATGIPGDELSLFTLDWKGDTLRFATLICVENTYPPLPARARRHGAQFFINITSEGMVRGPVQEQLLRICILRAVENRIPYVRAGNTGISGFIDARGHVQSILTGENGGTVDDQGVLVERLTLSPGASAIYPWSRDLFAKLCVVAAAILLVWSWIPRRRVAAPGQLT
jgi:apolipoprotein N-acyltransferase